MEEREPVKILWKVLQRYLYIVMDSYLIMQNYAFWKDLYPQNLETEDDMLPHYL